MNPNMNMSKRRIILVNFLGGLSWGLGTVIGATVIVAILVAVLRIFNFIPGLSEFLDQLTPRK